MCDLFLTVPHCSRFIHPSQRVLLIISINMSSRWIFVSCLLALLALLAIATSTPIHAEHDGMMMVEAELVDPESFASLVEVNAHARANLEADAAVTLHQGNQAQAEGETESEDELEVDLNTELESEGESDSLRRSGG